MAYQVLARRWRPQRFEDVVGQEHVTRTLGNAIQTGRLAHAFLFCGPRGVGKTTTARILAKSLNCETASDGPVGEPCNECTVCREISEGVSLDVLEIDGASNRGIDEIRDLRENVRYAPSGGRAKVYIIDEVHMLTKEAFNALLKTLEEPPPGVYFVFATTEIHKVPATIRSRCQRYDFRRIPAELIAKTLAKVAKREKFQVDKAALAELARQADGGLRDAESLLDQAAAIGSGKVTLEGLREILGEAETESYLAIVEALAARDAGVAFGKLADLLDRGMDPGRVAVALTQTLRDLLVTRSAPGAAARLGVREDLVEEHERIGMLVSADRLTAFLALASRAVSELRRSPRPRLSLEVTLARMSRLEDPGELDSLLRRVEELRTSLGGAPPAGPSPPAPRTGGRADSPGTVPTRATPSPQPAASKRPAPAARTPPPPTSEPADAVPTPAKGRVRAARSASRAAVAGSPEGPPPEAFEPAPDPDGPDGPDASGEPVVVRAPGPQDELWSGLVERVRARKVMLASFLEHGVPTGVEADALTAVFDNNYYEGMVTRRENLAIIHEELASLAGRAVAFRARVGRVPGGAKARGSANEEKKGTRAQDLLKENPGLSRVVHDLGGQLLPGGGSSPGGGA